jgi:uncharacterized protein YfkK (UPF0435 family)
MEACFHQNSVIDLQCFFLKFLAMHSFYSFPDAHVQAREHSDCDSNTVVYTAQQRLSRTNSNVLSTRSLLHSSTEATIRLHQFVQMKSTYSVSFRG